MYRLDRHFSLLHQVHTGSKILTDTVCLFPQRYGAGSIKLTTLLHTVAKIKNVWSFPLISLTYFYGAIINNTSLNLESDIEIFIQNQLDLTLQ
jgi:hypothetical protein